MPSLPRRRFIALAGSGIGAVALSACSLTHAEERPDVPAAAAAVTSTPTPRPTPPVRPRGRVAMSLMKDTQWQADGVAIHSGQPGPRIMVLGGVHGNEPGGWLAAEAISGWDIQRGSVLVFPRVNWRSAAAFERTLPGYGDLNRAYPGDPNSSQPMVRMAAAVVEAGRAFQPDVLFDLHESWVFFGERGAAGGTAYLGQTVTIGTGASDAAADWVADIVRTVNAQITSREEFYLRGSNRPQPGLQSVPNNAQPGQQPQTPPSIGAGGTNGVNPGGTSSLSLGRWIEGCVPILIEMGQQNQEESRRSELHQMLVRNALTRVGML